MKVSVNWVKKFTDIQLPLDQLVEKIGAQLGAVDEVINVGEKYKGAVVAKVISCQKHPNADKLSLCLIDDGGVVKGVERVPYSQGTRASSFSVRERVAEEAVLNGTATEQQSSEAENEPKRGGVSSFAGKQASRSSGLVQVVCGAPNIAAGQLVVWLPPGATVPSSFDKDPLVLEAREIRGTISNGMIASAKELAIGDDHSGIVVIEDDVKPGTPFAAAYELDDHIIDIENKMFTHRPDLFGMLGIAREVAGITHKPFKSPAWYKQDAELHNDGRKNVLKLAVANELPKLVPRFCAVAIKDIRVAPSPLWLRTYLSRVGVRPINNIVDMTNYLMLETAQPLHAYDYDKVKTGTLGVREAKDNEELTLLGGKSIKLKKGVIVITDGQRPIGLGGVMGGADTEVDSHTRNIILEVATFDMNTTRRTAMDYGLFTDAASRFTKGQSPRQNRAVIVKAAEVTRQIAGGRLASKIVDDKHFKAGAVTVETDAQFINSRLGLDLTGREMARLLQNVEFEVTSSGAKLAVRPPFWRTDIEIPEDIVEEIGRLYGYDHLAPQLPSRTIKPPVLDDLLSLKSKIRGQLAAAGANELLTYSFVHESLLKKAGQDPKQAYHIKNALSPELQCYRLSLIPSLLDKVHPNIKLGFDEFALFEINKSHNKASKDEIEKDLPREIETLALVVAGRDKTHNQRGSAYYQARTYLDFLASRLGVELNYKPLLAEPDVPAGKPFEIARSAHIFVAGSERIAGVVGEFKPAVAAGLKLPSYCAGFEISINQLLRAARPEVYRPLNRYPSLAQDLCLRTPSGMPYQQLTDFLRGMLDEAAKTHGYIYEISPVDVFQRQDDNAHKQTTWHIELVHPERTLTTEEVNKLFDKIAEQAKVKLNAERI